MGATSLRAAWNDRYASGFTCRPPTLALQLSGEVRRMTTTQLRSLKPVRSHLAGLVVPVAMLSLVAVAAPTARADAVDSNFVNALNSRGITFASPQAAIIAAHEVCDELDSGRASSDVANDVMQQSSLDGYHAGFFVGVSIAAFCPRHAGS
jgi:Protein of unknown function (DUF732)